MRPYRPSLSDTLPGSRPYIGCLAARRRTAVTGEEGATSTRRHRSSDEETRMTARHCSLPSCAGLVLAAASGWAADETGLQHLRGELLVEGVHQSNYRPGRSDVNQLWMRAVLGAKLVFDKRLEAQIGFAADFEGGDDRSRRADDRSDVVISDAYLTLKEFLSPDWHWRLGRQPMTWNLRADHGGFLYDSRADDPSAQGWDGVRTYVEFDRLTLHGFAFRLNESHKSRGIEEDNVVSGANNSLLGAAFDWHPRLGNDGQLFISALVSWETNPPVPGLGKADLYTYNIGFEAKLDNGIDLYGELAVQDGKTDDGRKFKGYGGYIGADWHIPGPYRAVAGIQYDQLSGDRNPDTGDIQALITPWEGMSDTYIVEHERYGELSRYVQGNRQAIKLKLEYGFYDDRLRMRALGANYRLDKAVGGSRDFGTEVNLGVFWQYTYNLRLGLFGGWFEPGRGFREAVLAQTGEEASKSDILFGAFSAHLLY